MPNFEKTEENKLRISKEETIIQVQELSLEELEHAEQNLSQHIERMEKEIEEHKLGLKNIQQLKEKCAELNIVKEVVAEEVVADEVVDVKLKP